jgi:hypothetical protein
MGTPDNDIRHAEVIDILGALVGLPSISGEEREIAD